MMEIDQLKDSLTEQATLVNEDTAVVISIVAKKIPGGVNASAVVQGEANYVLNTLDNILRDTLTPEQRQSLAISLMQN